MTKHLLLRASLAPGDSETSWGFSLTPLASPFQHPSESFLSPLSLKS